MPGLDGFAETVLAGREADLDDWVDRETRRRHGLYMTPPDLAARHVELVRTLTGTPSFVVEPSVGTGNYLAALTDVAGLALEKCEPLARVARTRAGRGWTVECADALARTLPAGCTVIGNPPYGRTRASTGLQRWVAPFATSAPSNNLHNWYVAFWGWASSSAAETVSLLTPSGFTVAPAFAGMRQVLAQRFSRVWVTDIPSDLTAGQANPFGIRTPVCIVTATRHGVPAVRYQAGFGQPWQPVGPTWSPRAPSETAGGFCGWQFSRTWPIATNPETLVRRWEALFAGGTGDPELFVPDRERSLSTKLRSGEIPLDTPGADATMTAPQPYTFRPFDHRWALLDRRLASYPRRPAPASGIAACYVKPEFVADGNVALTLTPWAADIGATNGAYGWAGIVEVDPERADELVGPERRVAQLAWAHGLDIGGAARIVGDARPGLRFARGRLEAGGVAFEADEALWRFKVGRYAVLRRWCLARLSPPAGRSALDALVAPDPDFAAGVLGLLHVLEAHA